MGGKGWAKPPVGRPDEAPPTEALELRLGSWRLRVGTEGCAAEDVRRRRCAPVWTCVDDGDARVARFWVYIGSRAREVGA